MQRYSFFHREPGDPPRFFAYVLNGLIAAAAAAAISGIVPSGQPRRYPSRRPAADPAELYAMYRAGAVLRRLGRREDTAGLVAHCRGDRLCGSHGLGHGLRRHVFKWGASLLRRSVDRLETGYVVCVPKRNGLCDRRCAPHLPLCPGRAATARRAEVSPVAVSALPDPGLSASEILLSEEKEEGRCTADMQQRLRGGPPHRRRGRVIVGHFADRVLDALWKSRRRDGCLRSAEG